MAYNLSRMTIYALVSALEEDLRQIVKDQLGMMRYKETIFDQNLTERAKTRLERDTDIKYDEEEIFYLIDYFDLGDTFQTINSNPILFQKQIASEIKNKTRQFEKIVQIRNRVMHIRPLDFDDLAFSYDFCSALLESSSLIWKNIGETISRLGSDPSFVLSLKIRNYDGDGPVSHNLPLPDFDETGLIGRDATVKHILKLCKGNFPVISIVGEGGVGKSALALKVAYELLEEKNLFDAVVWVSSKTTQISINEIRDIRGAISSSVGVIQEISTQLSGQSTEKPLEEIAEYLSTFRVALFIDNLETILDANIRDFVSSLPNGSKLIITSRIGLGAYEYPVKLNGIEESYAAQLIRALAKIRNVQVLAKLEEGVLRKYATRMHLNPGYIKWFVSATQTGVAPESILQNSQLFLEFCMSNVYNYLSEDARLVTSTMQCAPGLKDVAELAYLCDFEAIRIQRAITELMSTNMLSEASKVMGGSIKTTYQLSELPKAYLNKHHRVTNYLQERIRTARNKLNSFFEARSKKYTNRYDVNSIVMRQKNDRVIIKILTDSIKDINSGKLDKIYEALEEAQRLAPDYFEVARVMALFQQKIGNYPEARSSYELAITLSPETSQLHFWFGKFLLRDEEILEEAIIHFENSHRLDPSSIEVGIELARAYMFQQDFPKSREIANKFNGELDSDWIINHKLIDIKVQLPYREADVLAVAGKNAQAILSLQEMRREFDAAPTKFKDSYTRNKLSKVHPTVARLLRQCRDTEKLELLEIQKWLTAEAYN